MGQKKDSPSSMRYLDYLKGNSADYIEELFEQYRVDPHGVDETWRYFFDGLGLGEETISLQTNPLDQSSNENGSPHESHPTNGALHLNESSASSNGHSAPHLDLSAEAKVADLINAYRERGRLLADLNPLTDPIPSHSFLDLQVFGLGPDDLKKSFTAGNLIGLGNATLEKILSRLKEIYCSSIGVEFTHIKDPVAREWLQNKLETSQGIQKLTPELKKRILSRLTESETFEQFLHTRYVAQKRFSLEGGESLIPMLDRIIEVAADLGANNVVMGMAHRGRLNVLTHIFGKKPEYIFTEFEENYEQDQVGNSGDVKYHKGFSSDIQTSSGHPVHLSLAHNPSHLEFVNPVVEGVARAKQLSLGDHERSQVVPILIHGDAAFSGQGVVYETLNLSQLEGYWTGGTVHIVIDNQIGFTTSPTEGRSTTYSTDVAKMLEVPIFHVNGDDPEAVWTVAQLSTEYRQKFKKDVFIDLICYRKYGHNEGDEPAFTQPLLYKKIKGHPSPRKIYAQRLIDESVVSSDEAQEKIDHFIESLTAAQDKTRSEKLKPFSSSYEGAWKTLRPHPTHEPFKQIDTQFSEKKLIECAQQIFRPPENFGIHPKLKRLMDPVSYTHLTLPTKRIV